MDFLARTEPRCLVSWHQPLHGVDTDRVKDLALSKRLAQNLQLPLKGLDFGGVCHGTMTAWFNHTYVGAAVTLDSGFGDGHRACCAGAGSLRATTHVTRARA